MPAPDWPRRWRSNILTPMMGPGRDPSVAARAAQSQDLFVNTQDVRLHHCRRRPRGRPRQGSRVPHRGPRQGCPRPPHRAHLGHRRGHLRVPCHLHRGTHLGLFEAPCRDRYLCRSSLPIWGAPTPTVRRARPDARVPRRRFRGNSTPSLSLTSPPRFFCPTDQEVLLLRGQRRVHAPR